MEWCNGSTTDFGSVSSGSSPDSIATHFNFNNMSSKKSFNATATFAVLNPEELQKLVSDLFNNKPKFPKHFSHPALVEVRSGDGIGFDAGNCVAVTNAKNNVGLLVKDNYETPFKSHKSLRLSKHAICHTQDLVPGHTYLIGDTDSFAFSKYLGHLVMLVRTADTCDVINIEDGQIPLHYELSVPNQSK